MFSSLHNKFSSLHNKFSSLHNKFSSLHNTFSSLHNKFSSLQNKFSSLHNKTPNVEMSRLMFPLLFDTATEYLADMVSMYLESHPYLEEMYQHTKKDNSVLTTQTKKGNFENSIKSLNSAGAPLGGA
ncbi:hypothetical protein DPMN_146242 [Dreissena polymorpha]|uniref:Uncharacterized protein n=1 Tax=Dreissena polymorpha TaxID=45954 RepID=A0A9D4F6A2_DREPO|nr:hypothetical protein DPMN_146242 [Dreissena polymorpha]